MLDQFLKHPLVLAGSVLGIVATGITIVAYIQNREYSKVQKEIAVLTRDNLRRSVIENKDAEIQREINLLTLAKLRREVGIKTAS